MKTRNRVQSKTANKETKLFNCRNQIPGVLIARILLQMSVTHSAVCFQGLRAQPPDLALAASMRTCWPPGGRTSSSRWWRGPGRGRGCSPGPRRGRGPGPPGHPTLRGQRPRPLTAPRPASRGLASERGRSLAEARPVTPRQRGWVLRPGARAAAQGASQETRGCPPPPPPCLPPSQGARGWCRPGASLTPSTPTPAQAPGRSSPSRRCSPLGFPRVTRWRRGYTTCSGEAPVILTFPSSWKPSSMYSPPKPRTITHH